MSDERLQLVKPHELWWFMFQGKKRMGYVTGYNLNGQPGTPDILEITFFLEDMGAAAIVQGGENDTR